MTRWLTRCSPAPTAAWSSFSPRASSSSMRITSSASRDAALRAVRPARRSVENPVAQVSPAAATTVASGRCSARRARTVVAKHRYPSARMARSRSTAATVSSHRGGAAEAPTSKTLRARRSPPGSSDSRPSTMSWSRCFRAGPQGRRHLCRGWHRPLLIDGQAGGAWVRIPADSRSFSRIHVRVRSSPALGPMPRRRLPVTAVTSWSWHCNEAVARVDDPRDDGRRTWPALEG